MAPEPEPSEQEDEVLRLAETFGAIARALAAYDEVQVTLDMIVRLAVDTLEDCEFAGISLIERGAFSSPASSNNVPRIVDHIQSELGEGPCIDSIREHKVVQTGDLATEVRWPRFSRRAKEQTGVRSVLSIRLFIEDDTMGALNLYSTRRDAFVDTDVALASVFAVHAAVAMAAARRNQNLLRMAQTRDMIGQAKGILMARQHVTNEQAFDMLRRASQRLNIKLKQIAEEIVSRTESEAK